MNRAQLRAVAVSADLAASEERPLEEVCGMYDCTCCEPEPVDEDQEYDWYLQEVADRFWFARSLLAEDFPLEDGTWVQIHEP